MRQILPLSAMLLMAFGAAKPYVHLIRYVDENVWPMTFPLFTGMIVTFAVSVLAFGLGLAWLLDRGEKLHA